MHPSSSEVAVDARGVVRHFGAVRAVDGIDLSVARGHVVSVLGPNGAGKTTLVRILATLVPPDAGAVRIFGHDLVTEPHAVRRHLALTGQFAAVDQDLTGRENLVLFGRLHGLGRRSAHARAAELLEVFGLQGAASRQVRTYSGGMRRRLDIAASLVVAANLLFLDEPTTGLDPASRSRVWQLVRELVGCGVTVVLTTQYLEEADQLADGIVVIDHGRVVAQGSPDELKAAVGRDVLRVRLDDAQDLNLARDLLVGRLAAAVELEGDAAALVARIDDTDAVGPALTDLASRGIGVTSVSVGQPSLDEVFVALTGDDAPEPAAATTAKEPA